MKTLRILFVAVIAIMVIQYLSGCRREKSTDGPDYNTIKDHAIAESNYDDALNITDEAASGSLQYKSTCNLLSACSTVTNDTTSVPHVLTIDFGSTNCLCNDGKERRGKIIASYNGGYRDSTTLITITFNNYFVDNNQVEGTKTVYNEGRNQSGNYWYTIHVNGTVVRANNGGTITWTSDRTREWIEGESTIIRLDDVYLINGTVSGTSAAGTQFNVNIITPLRKEMSCGHFVSGVVTITRTGKPDITVDYGDGTCDADVTIVINNNTYNYSL